VGLVRWRTAFAALACAGVLAPVAGLGAAPAYAADDPAARRRRVTAELAASKGDLDESSAAVRSAAAALDAVAVALPRAEARVAAVAGQLAGARAAVTAAAAARAAAQADLDRCEAAYAAAQARLAAARARAGALARAVYMTGPGGFYGSLLSSQSASDLAARVTYVHALLTDGSGRVRAAGDARAELAGAASVLAARRAAVAARERDAATALARVQALVDAARSAEADVAAQVGARRTALAAAARERAADLARYRDLQRESARLAEIARRASRGDGRVGRGGMLWPTPGPVTSGFGWRIHPIYHYRRFHPGVDIGAPTGQPIVAALAGVVVQAGPMGTYGNIVVVDHGNGFATAYAHQSRILVTVGQRLARGQRLGLVGETGAATGPHLHFETRVNGEPVDPLQYY
jgi:murein DD-endopeptidase MepM/ murein hydrolase activator NlpD